MSLYGVIYVSVIVLFSAPVHPNPTPHPQPRTRWVVLLQSGKMVSPREVAGPIPQLHHFPKHRGDPASVRFAVSPFHVLSVDLAAKDKPSGRLGFLNFFFDPFGLDATSPPIRRLFGFWQTIYLFEVIQHSAFPCRPQTCGSSIPSAGTGSSCNRPCVPPFPQRDLCICGPVELGVGREDQGDTVGI